MSVELSWQTMGNRQADAACWWQFNLGRARSLLGPGLVAPEAEWGRDGDERFLAEVRIVAVSEAALRLFGLPNDPARLVSRPIGNVWPDASHSILTELLTSLAGSGGDRIVRELGRMERWTDVVLTGWRSGDPRCPDDVFVTVSATLDAPGALRELEASQTRYRSLIGSIPLPIWDVDARAMGRIFGRLQAEGVTDMADYIARHPEMVELACDIVVVTEANRDAIELFGAGAEAELLQPVRYMFAHAMDAAYQVMLAHAAGQRNYVGQIKVKTFDGRIRDVMMLVTYPVPGEQLDTTLIMMIDNTTRFETEARLRQLEADFTDAARLSTLGQMSASIAHEIKQPLSAILTNAETTLRWLAKPDPNLPKVTQLAERIAGSAQRATDIIARIQDMAQKRRTPHVMLDLNDVIREALIFVRHDSEEKSIRLTLEMDHNLPAIVGDRIQLQQVVVNLLVNSGQALEAVEPERREIRVTTYRDGAAGVGFAIRDSGPGIPEIDLDRVFGGFFSTKDGGMGIGLTISQTIIAAHRGRITAVNCPLGEGAEFRVALPAATPA